jgi:hypothetical protein
MIVLVKLNVSNSMDKMIPPVAVGINMFDFFLRTCELSSWPLNKAETTRIISWKIERPENAALKVNAVYR